MKVVALKIVTFCLFIFAVFSCNKEEDNTGTRLIGIWRLTEKTLDNTPVALSDCEKQSNIEFQEKNFCLLFDACAGIKINSGWNYKNEMLNISEYLPAAFYIDHLDKVSLRVLRKDISESGSLQVTTYSYLKELP